MRVATLVLLVVPTSSAFQSAITLRPSPLKYSQRQRHPPVSVGRYSKLHQSNDGVEGSEDDQYELVDFIVTPEQISLLRKEATKREARKTLTKFFLPDDESTEISTQTAAEISSLFETSELIEVRGVSKGKKPNVFETVHGLAAALEDEIEKPVVVVDIKGFAVKLFCPWEDSDRSGWIQLRTSYKPGQWTRKAKPIRDDRGQIITDESGKSIKEIPEF